MRESQGCLKTSFVFLLLRLGSIKNSFAESEDDDDDDVDGEEPVSKPDTTGSSRVRTMISDDQAAVLKARYSENPKPRREELVKISAEIGHPFKVVKVSCN